MPTSPILVERCRRDFYAAFEVERLRQVSLGYDAELDDRLSAAEWVSILARHVGLIADDGGKVQDLKRCCRQLVRIGAVALAALEVLARLGIVPEQPAGPVVDKPVPVLPPEERSRIG